MVFVRVLKYWRRLKIIKLFNLPTSHAEISPGKWGMGDKTWGKQSSTREHIYSLNKLVLFFVVDTLDSLNELRFCRLLHN